MGKTGGSKRKAQSRQEAGAREVLANIEKAEAEQQLRDAPDDSLFTLDTKGEETVKPAYISLEESPAVNTCSVHSKQCARAPQNNVVIANLVGQ
jgi:hypothetical protein